MKFLLVLVMVSITVFADAQKAVTYTIKPGEFIADIIPAAEIMKYPDFRPGTVFFKDGKSVSGILNYNMLIDAVQFIDPQADTLSLANEETIRRIVISADVFYYNRGYYRVIDTGINAMLSEHIYFKPFAEKQSSYGLASSTAASDNFSSILERRAYNLTAAEEMKLVKHTEYAILDSSGMIMYPDKKHLLKTVKQNKTKVSDYLAKNPADPGKMNDLRELAKLLNKL